MRRSDLSGFEWDKGNVDKSYEKHGISPEQSEEVFTDEHVVIVPDIAHSIGEERLIAIGKSNEQQVLFVIFTKRRGVIRIISARRANKKERSIYETQKA